MAFIDNVDGGIIDGGYIYYRQEFPNIINKSGNIVKRHYKGRFRTDGKIIKAVSISRQVYENVMVRNNLSPKTLVPRTVVFTIEKNRKRHFKCIRQGSVLCNLYSINGSEYLDEIKRGSEDFGVVKSKSEIYKINRERLSKLLKK